jgi:hypothetical protein
MDMPGMIEVSKYTQLYVFDLFKKVENTSSDENKNSVDNPMLPVVLKAIFESTTVEQRNQLPLAIRYNDRANVKKVLTASGIKMEDDPAQELTVDGRQLIYAAFYDDSKIVREMLQAGFEVSQLDHLIALEIRQEMCSQKLLEHTRKGATWFTKPMPDWRLKRHRQGDTEDETLDAWEQLPKEEQIAITIEELRRVSWDKMSFVNGWTYRVIVQADEDVKVKVVAGTLFRQTGAKKVLPAPFSEDDGSPVNGTEANRRVAVRAAKVELICTDKSCGYYKDKDELEAPFKSRVWGQVITEEEAKPYIEKRGRNDYGNLASDSIRTMDRMLGVANATAVKPGDGTEVYVKAEHPDLGWLILRREPDDEVVGCLELGGQKDRQSEGIQRAYRKNNVGSLMYNRAQKAFAPWLDEALADFDLLAQPFDPLLRIYWAIATRRDELAKVFWLDASNPDVFQPFVGAFMASFTYKKMGLGFHTGIQRKERSRKNMKRKWDKVAADLLDCMEGSGNVLQSGSQVFDKYIFFGEDEEELWKKNPDTTETEFGDLTPAQRRSNASIRSALRIMGSDARTEWTHVDLALLAENKDFMGHRYTNKFIDDIWSVPCASDKGLHRPFAATPRQKYTGRFISVCLFLVLYVYVYMNYEYPTVVAKRQQEGLYNVHDNPTARNMEGMFWYWVLSYIASEYFQYRTDFDSLSAYLTGEGNWMDVCTSVLFLLAGLSRVLAVLLTSQLCYVTMHIILMFNLILYTWRLSILLGVHQQIGMMMIGASVDKTTRMQHRPVPLSPPSSSLPIFATCFVVPDGPVVAVV